MLPPKKIKELAFYLLASPIGAPGGIRTPGLPVRSATIRIYKATENSMKYRYIKHYIKN